LLVLLQLVKTQKNANFYRLVPNCSSHCHCRWSYLSNRRSHKWTITKLCGRPPQYAHCKLTFDLLTYKVVRVTCDMGYLCANYNLPRPLCSRVRPDVRDRRTEKRQTSDRRQTRVIA